MQKTLKQLTCAAFAVGALASCNEYVDYVDNTQTSTQASYQEKLSEFASNFEKEFGTPDPNHTWGFGVNVDFNDPAQIAELEKYAEAWKMASPAITRAKVDDSDHTSAKAASILVNVNEWTMDRDFALGKRVHIPGYPNDDNINYTQNNYHNPATASATGNAAGDVTDYEIWYVSKWFREHQAGTPEFESRKVLLHLSDFFIQNVSRDNDRNADGSFITQWTEAGQGLNYEMNQLKFQDLNGDWTHINNFNNSDNKIPENGGSATSPTQSASQRLIMYVQSSGTENFIYHPSLDQNSGYYDKYVLIKLEWDEPMADGQTHPRVGYYLAFDYECEYTNNGIKYTYSGDDYYSNWILKVSPGYFKQGARWPKRFMCEDLGNTFDFDFNDAVFDLTFTANAEEANWYDAVLTIHAAGGTIPILVGITPNSFSDPYEIHKLLGSKADSPTSLSPINLGPGTASSEVAIYRVKHLFKNDYSFVQSTDEDWVKPADYDQALLNLWGQMANAAFTLSIYVDQNRDGQFVDNVSGWEVLKNLQNYYNNGVKSNNDAPQLFNCSTKAYWMRENQHINSAYEWFSEWVQDEKCAHRLEWDKSIYYQRNDKGETTAINLDPATYLGAWDQMIKPGATNLVWPKYGTMKNAD